MFTRTLPIPFSKKKGKETISQRLTGRMEFDDLLNESRKSVGVLLKLHKAFQGMIKDPLFEEIEEIVQNLQLDPRSEVNFATLLYSTRKVLKFTILKHSCLLLNNCTF